MQLEEVKLTNFRGYGRTVTIRLNSLTAFIGKNDVGKSTVLEALDIFFNGTNAVHRISSADVNRLVSQNDDTKVDIEIACVFSDVDGVIVLDDCAETTFSDERMLRSDGKLELVRVYANGGKPKTYVETIDVGCGKKRAGKKQGLLELKMAELKQLVAEFKIKGANQSSNVSMRAALRHHILRSEEAVKRRELLSDDIAEHVNNYLPRYELFLADRENTDGDSEAQDPVKAAVRRVCAREDIKAKLNAVGDIVRREIAAVLRCVREMTGEFDLELMQSLSPVLPRNEELKWPDVFKPVTFEDVNRIPLNKRGSGVKRMVLMGMLRADVERTFGEDSDRGVIYAIEEPETGQHADNQIRIIDTILTLASRRRTQVLVTSHSAIILCHVPMANIRFMAKDRGFARLETKHCKHGIPVLKDSIAEIAYLLFGECAVEYHNELYGLFTALDKWKEFEDHFVKGKVASLKRMWDRDDGKEPIGPQPCSLSYFIRNKIHHPENKKNGDKYTESELRQSIQMMRLYIREHHLGVSVESLEKHKS